MAWGWPRGAWCETASRPPVTLPPALPSPPGGRGEGARAQTMLSTPQILLIDDDRAWLETLAEYLRNKGFAIAAFNDPLQGLAWGEQSGVPLAVIDFQMPGMNGLELL